MSGCSFLNFDRMSGSSDEVARTLKTIVDSFAPEATRISFGRLSSAPIIPFSLSCSARPALLSSILFPFLSNNAEPSSVSSSFTALLTDGCETCSSSAAFEKFSYLATVRKYLS